VDARTIAIDKTMFDEVFLITTTLEELGYLTAHFNEVKRLTTTSLKQIPWVVSLHDLEIIAKYMPTASEFIHFLRLRILLNDNATLRTFDELDWLGRYFYDSLEIADAKEVLNSGLATTGSLVSHSSPFDDFERFENGIRQTPAERPTSNIHEVLKSICKRLSQTRQPGYLNVGSALLALPGKLRRGFAKRIRNAASKAIRKKIIQETALAKDGSIAFVCSVCGQDVDGSSVGDPTPYGSAKLNVHLIIRSDLSVVEHRQKGR
jgi:hypothetical protein